MYGIEDDALELILVGGGLANGLIAYRLVQQRPQTRFLVIEKGSTLGGNHTWSYHDGDVDAEQHAWLEPFVEHRWPSHDVRFPVRRRRIHTGYRSFGAARFDAVLREALGPRVRLGVCVQQLTSTRVMLSDGTQLNANAVVDGRGPQPTAHMTLRYQKFFGQVLELRAPHGLEAPVLMDATVLQGDDYRFFYALPYGPDTLLIEDTRYSDSPALDRDALAAEISLYAAGQGWRIRRKLHDELGVLPIVLSGDIDAYLREGASVPRSGLRGGFFHHTTGYSLPEAVRLADAFVSFAPFRAAELDVRLAERARRLWRGQAFFRLLNRMLFLAGAPDQRYRVLERFYRLPQPLIARFYAGRLTGRDRLRLLSGTPPVPLSGALRAAFSSGASANPVTAEGRLQ